MFTANQIHEAEQGWGAMISWPCFLFLAGDLMSGGGISERMVKACQRVVGHIKGGLSQVDIVASMIFSGVSGSSMADASAIGSVMIPAMKQDGFPGASTAAVTAAKVGTLLLGPWGVRLLM